MGRPQRPPSWRWASPQTWPTGGPAERRSPSRSAAGPTLGGSFPALASVHACLQRDGSKGSARIHQRETSIMGRLKANHWRNLMHVSRVEKQRKKEKAMLVLLCLYGFPFKTHKKPLKTFRLVHAVMIHVNLKMNTNSPFDRRALLGK